MVNNVVIDPRNSFQYSSFYMKGLYDILKSLGGRISFNIRPFRDLADPGNDMRFIIFHDAVATKYFIHTNDPFHIKEEDYSWCDVYGCVNTNYSHYPKDKYPKLISLCPSFAVIPGSRLFAWRMAICCFIEAFDTIGNKQEWNEEKYKYVINKWSNIKKYWTRFYKGIYRRQFYEDYLPIESEPNYIFTLNTLWYNNNENKNDEGVNLRRATFIRACKELETEGICCFEGGFSNRSSSKSYDKFEDCISDSVSMKEWVKKSKKSSLVFNTPAFWACHGWKLGEYLAMGKCIVSTKLSNDLPAPLIHGVHMHYVNNDKESMKEAIMYILSHPEYRHKLENGAREYWQKWGTPQASLKLLGITEQS